MYHGHKFWTAVTQKSCNMSGHGLMGGVFATNMEDIWLRLIPKKNKLDSQVKFVDYTPHEIKLCELHINPPNLVTIWCLFQESMHKNRSGQGSNLLMINGDGPTLGPWQISLFGMMGTHILLTISNPGIVPLSCLTVDAGEMQIVIFRDIISAKSCFRLPYQQVKHNQQCQQQLPK